MWLDIPLPKKLSPWLEVKTITYHRCKVEYHSHHECDIEEAKTQEKTERKAETHRGEADEQIPTYRVIYRKRNLTVDPNEVRAEILYIGIRDKDSDGKWMAGKEDRWDLGEEEQQYWNRVHLERSG